ncbi:hypothetical protein TanjilG_12657 [Lupinus angustifolius]|uniref:CRAL/TRIO N-terminal domain-containing protein n=1 Tax=Lupinus angustifolius TaxID=3871 RepID=A0A4P1QYZ3_LUPAN|nr:hypothetical protein TanjilG_12657 [Lupinus angustifolius]
MSVTLSKNASKGHEQMLISQEQEAKINEVRKLIGSLSDKASVYCSDASISRYLSSRNWNVQKGAQMLKLSLKWREEYKPEEICWVSYCLPSLLSMIFETQCIDAMKIGLGATVKVVTT